ncbi:ABC transporter permease [Saccharothrix violaceirubra]|uniref:Transport permease protein n=1 Tax=Saccharothrix violaceirubra TaxID=413306 RepID=A0A7W7T5I9_9PSEU|nr:ABC transporter permease [Saccharothrix violaceirubra]MBB4966671.1 ABC-2 type transport system permease protein [Saccharothrix violaceirubra]
MSLATTVSDSATMLRRNLRHTLRNPVTLFGSLAFPIIMLLLFVYVLGGAFEVGGDYLDYVVPGMLVLSMGYGVTYTAISVSGDVLGGIVDRFRTMAVSRAAVLTGHVVGTLLRTAVCTALMVGVTLLMGFRPDATVVEWIAALGVVAMLVFAITWFTVALGLAAGSAEGASFAAFPLTFLPFLSSAFVPPETMPAAVRAFADHQPFTPVIETLRGLLTGTPIGHSAWIAALWCAGIALVGYLWARARFTRDPSK